MNIKLHDLLKKEEILVAPGAHDALTAKIIEKTGFKAVYGTGAGNTASMIGKPDLGFLTMSEMVQRWKNISNAVNIPLIADADTGFGNPLNVRRTVQEYERVGVEAIQMEDQVFPKKCGHMRRKKIIEKDEMAAKIKATVDARKNEDFLIMARTDAIATDGMDEAISRAMLYEKAGADIIFVEAPESEEQMRQINEEVDGYTIANMVEGGKTPLKKAKELEDLGYDLVIFPGASARVTARAVFELMEELKREGTTEGFIDRMYLFDKYYNEILDLPEYEELENKYSVE